MDSEVKDDLSQNKADETVPLPDLVANAYMLLGKDWLETKKNWEEAGHITYIPRQTGIVCII